MVRSNWARLVIVGLASASLTWGQSPAPPPAWAPASSAIVTVQEPEKTARQCRVLRTWREPDGRERQELQAIDTGEVFTLDRPAPEPVIEKVVPAATSSVPLVTPPPECIITVTENGKDIKCKPVKSWLQPDGAQAYLVRAIESDELLTLVEMADESSTDKSPANVRTTRIFHWGKSNVSPPGAPVPPDAPVVKSVPVGPALSPAVAVLNDASQRTGPAVEMGKPEPTRQVPPEVSGRILASTPPASAAAPAPQEKSVMSRLFRWGKGGTPPSAKGGQAWVGAPAPTKQGAGQQLAPVAGSQGTADAKPQTIAAAQDGKGSKEQSTTNAQPQVAAASWTAPAPQTAVKPSEPEQPKGPAADSWHPTASQQNVPPKEGRGFFSFLRKEKPTPSTPEPIAPPTPLVVGRPVPKGLYASRSKPEPNSGRVEPAFLPPTPVKAPGASLPDVSPRDFAKGIEYPQPTDWRESWRDSPPMPKVTEPGGPEAAAPAVLPLASAGPKPPPDPVPSEMFVAKPKVAPAVVKGTSFQAEAPPAVTKGLLTGVNNAAPSSPRVAVPKEEDLKVRKSAASASGPVQRVSASERMPEITSERPMPSRLAASHTNAEHSEGSPVTAVAKQMFLPNPESAPPATAKRLPAVDSWSAGSSTARTHAAWLPEGQYAATLPPATTPSSSLPPVTGNQSVIQAGPTQVAFVPIATVPQGPPPTPPNPGSQASRDLPQMPANAFLPPPQPLPAKPAPTRPPNAFSDVPSFTPNDPQQTAPSLAPMRNSYHMPSYYPSTTPSYPYAMYPAAPYVPPAIGPQTNPCTHASAGPYAYPGSGPPAGPYIHSPVSPNNWRQPLPQASAYLQRTPDMTAGTIPHVPTHNPASMGQVTYMGGRADHTVYPPYQANPMASSALPANQLQTVGYQPTPDAYAASRGLAASGSVGKPYDDRMAQQVPYGASFGPGTPGPSSAQPLLTILRDSVCFTDREWAADKLVHMPTQQVKEALLASCYSDPAPTVRVACIRSLMAMGANSMDVIQVLQALQSHEDVRVRHEAEQALRRLMPPQ